MAKFLISFIMCACFLGLLSTSQVFAAMPRFGKGENKVITQKIEDVVGDEVRNSDSVLRDGSYMLSEGVEGIYNDTKLEDTGTSWEKNANYIKGYINYFLSITGLIALLYLLYHGFMAVTAGTDEDQLKKGMEGVKYAGMAIIWIAVAWFVVSGVLWLTFIITENL
jgi:hypothetical protein